MLKLAAYGVPSIPISGATGESSKVLKLVAYGATGQVKFFQSSHQIICLQTLHMARGATGQSTKVLKLAAYGATGQVKFLQSPHLWFNAVR